MENFHTYIGKFTYGDGEIYYDKVYYCPRSELYFVEGRSKLIEVERASFEIVE